MLDWFRGRGNAETGPRDGEVPVLERMALSDQEIARVAAPSVATTKSARLPRDRQRDILLGTLSEKVLNIHLANRFQTAYPLVLNFLSLESASSRLLMEVAALALLSDPRTASQPGAARERLAEAQASEALLAAFDDAMVRPRASSFVFSETSESGLSSHAYAVSLLAFGRPSATARHYLAYLANRLGLGEEITGSLKRRYQR